jgi:hypothetical protein
VAGAVASLAAATVAATIGVARFAVTLAEAGDDGPALDSWVYRPGWTILQVAFALLAAGTALVSLTAPRGRRPLTLVATVVAAAVLGWALNDGAYQVIASLYYLEN